MRTGLILVSLILVAASIAGCRQAEPEDTGIVPEPAPVVASQTLTLSSEQLLALDWSGRSPSGGTVIRKWPVEGPGTAFDIQFPGNRPWQNSINYLSSGSGGRMALVGLDVASYDTLALKFKLVAIDGAVGPSLPQELTIGAVVGPTAEGKLSTYEPFKLSFSENETVIVRTPITVPRLRDIGFHVEMANPEVWSEDGALVTILVEPVGEAISPTMPIVEEEPQPRERPQNLPDFGPGRTGAW